MTTFRHVAAVCCSALLLAACGKPQHPPLDAAALQPASAAAIVPAVPSVVMPEHIEPTAAQAERAKKQSLLDYSTMEDGYINDPRAQWATSAKASSTFGEGQENGPARSNLASNMTGPVDGETWTNNQQNLGFDWVQAEFAKPVHATEIRVVFHGGEGVEAVNKLEVQDEEGHWTTVWSGLSDVKSDARGDRTWFVKSFDRTANPVKVVKVTIANNVQAGYKVVDALQLVGE